MFTSLEPAACGSPDRQQNTTVTGGDFRVGKTIKYSCPEGHKFVGNATRECLDTGFWSGVAPSCKCKYLNWNNSFKTNTPSIYVSQFSVDVKIYANLSFYYLNKRLFK